MTDDDEITILNPELIPETADGKLIRLDIHVKMTNRRFNIEMQTRKSGFDAERVLYYWCEMYGEDFASGGKYKGIDAVYALNADTVLREQIRQRDKAARDYENDMAIARAEGRAEEREAWMQKLRSMHTSEEEIRALLGAE